MPRSRDEVERSRRRGDSNVIRGFYGKPSFGNNSWRCASVKAGEDLGCCRQGLIKAVDAAKSMITQG